MGGFFQILGNDDALACCKSVSLDDNREGLCLQVFDSFVFVSEYFIGGCRDTVFLHERFCKALGAFNAGCRFGRAEESKSFCLELIGKAFGQNRFRSCYGQIDLHESCEIQNIFIALYRNEGGDVCHAFIARDCIKFCNGRTLGELPKQRMFASAASNN